MRDYRNALFEAIIKETKDKTVTGMNLPEEDIVFFQYFLTRNDQYAIIVDNYPSDINDKNSLLEALYYQVRLITMHDLNWDALQESLNDMLNNLRDFDGICLLFKSKEINTRIKDELFVLTGIIEDINKHSDKQIRLLVNQ